MAFAGHIRIHEKRQLRRLAVSAVCERLHYTLGLAKHCILYGPACTSLRGVAHTNKACAGSGLVTADACIMLHATRWLRKGGSRQH